MVDVTELVLHTFNKFTTCDILDEVRNIISLDGNILDNRMKVGAAAEHCILELISRWVIGMIAITVKIELYSPIIGYTTYRT